MSWFVELDRAFLHHVHELGSCYVRLTRLNLPKLVSWVSQCSTEWSAEMVCMGVYIHPWVLGARGAGTLGLVSALCFGLHCSIGFSCVSHRGVNGQTHGDSFKHKEHARLYCSTSVVTLYVWGVGGGMVLSLPAYRSIIKLVGWNRYIRVLMFKSKVQDSSSCRGFFYRYCFLKNEFFVFVIVFILKSCTTFVKN